MQTLNSFTEFIQRLSRQINYRQILENYETNYNLKKFKITEISTNAALQMFQHIVQKFYKNHSPGESGTWVENQLRLYIWAVVCYIEFNRKQLSNFTKQDWDFFARIFYVKEYNLFEYQARILLDQSVKLTKWSQEEDYLLYCIINKDKSAKWNQIAKTMFIKSEKKYLRASKQCRERWFNHLDPSKSKSQWNLKQYLTVFQEVANKGKKWALIVKALKERRSQHSIKNKYNSILKKQIKLNPELSEKQACQQLIDKINRILDSFQIESNDDYLFGCSLKLYKTQYKNRSFFQDHNKKQTKTTSGDNEISRNRFEIFRKKIQKFQCGQSEQPQAQVKTENRNKYKPTKKQSIQKQLHLTTLNTIQSSTQIKDSQKMQSPQPDQNDDEIFYDDSFDGNQMLKSQQFNVFYNDDIKDIMGQHLLEQ